MCEGSDFCFTSRRGTHFTQHIQKNCRVQTCPVEGRYSKFHVIIRLPDVVGILKMELVHVTSWKYLTGAVARVVTARLRY